MFDGLRQIVHAACDFVRSIDFCRTLQQTGVQIEYVTRISLTARRTFQQQGNLTVCYRLLGQVIVYDQGRTACITEKLTNSRTGHRRIELKRSRVCCRSRYDNCVSHGSTLFQCAHNICYGRVLLTYRDIYTEYRLTGIIKFLLVDDRIDTNRSLTRLTVADDQLTLTTADRNHRIDSLDTCLQRLSDGLTKDYPRSFAFDRHFVSFPYDWAFTVDRLSQRIHDTAQHTFTYLKGSNTVGTFNGITFFDFVRRSQKNDTAIVFFQVQYDTLYSICILNQCSWWTSR